ncbi:potassium channel family protein [Rubrivirga sp.]|uniref:potassium channel family protein n=1 Tax=Rubrivirga sp. TaxID=1885344 RepID=UPI003C732BE4
MLDRFGDTHKAALLLAGLVVHNLVYPLSGAGGIWPAAFYAFFASLFVTAVFGMTRSRWARASIAATGLAVLAAGLANSYAPGSLTPAALFVSVIAYHAVAIAVLARYVFQAEQVFTEVVLAATSLYLVIGSVFTAIFGLIEWLAPGSFASASGAGVEWQEFLYFSYVTLTSLGYGDILPVGYYAQAFAAFEAVVGVLYTVVLLSRLVSMYQTR